MIFAAYSQMVQKKKGGIEDGKLSEGIWVFIVIFLLLFCRFEVFFQK